MFVVGTVAIRSGTKLATIAMLPDNYYQRYQAIHQQLCGTAISFEQAKSELTSIMQLIKVVAQICAEQKQEATASLVESTNS